MDFQAGLWRKSRILIFSFCIIQSFPFLAHIRASPRNKRHIPDAPDLPDVKQVFEFGSGFATSVYQYYNPTTCIIRIEFPDVCQGGEEKNESMCKKLKCCPAIEDVPCYDPFLNKALQALRMFLTGFIALFLLALIPFVCCGFFQARDCCAPANRDAKKILEIKRKYAERKARANLQVQEKTIVKEGTQQLTAKGAVTGEAKKKPSTKKTTDHPSGIPDTKK